jgi:4-diphosphocytidyl-2-C-methyl-D-erythritol kinase
MSTDLVVQTPAKLNLGLAIIGRGDDGYHEVRTVLHAVGWCDHLRCVFGGVGPRVTTSDPAVADGPENLVHRAIAALEDASGYKLDVEIHIAKVIPAGAGLGGGSSNAGCALAALNAHVKLGLEASDLDAIASGLGADVPFFLSPGTALAHGRGDRLMPLGLRAPGEFVIVVPPVQVATAWAYAAYDRQLGDGRCSASPYLEMLGALENELDLACLAPILENDLETPVVVAHPVVASLKEALLAAGAMGAAMTGSGGAVFGIFEDARLARLARERLAAQGHRAVHCSSWEPAGP